MGEDTHDSTVSHGYSHNSVFSPRNLGLVRCETLQISENYDCYFSLHSYAYDGRQAAVHNYVAVLPKPSNPRRCRSSPVKRSLEVVSLRWKDTQINGRIGGSSAVPRLLLVVGARAYCTAHHFLEWKSLTCLGPVGASPPRLPLSIITVSPDGHVELYHIIRSIC